MKVLASLLVAVGLATTADAYMAASKNNTMSVGDGTTVTTNSTTTVFMGTEYNPDQCVLQFGSLKCDNNKDCAELNGYSLECVNLGNQNGKPKKVCQCASNQTEVCQNSTAPEKSGAAQFEDCSGGKGCVDSWGHVPTKLELRVCAEKLHCVKEVNTTASKPAEICHTCRSCIAQNDATGSKLTDVRRFDCRSICPAEILESLDRRNQEEVGIADELKSGSGSEASSSSGTGSEESSGEGSTGSSDVPSPSYASTVKVSVPLVVGSIVLTAVSSVMLN
ncbi:hypothetical protein Poli38472_010946 [Pythium oligandrum]|uniref:Secreted protein n=1 Tax=Pythium oligandrum TaxID=41045 RepID=A0A8K1CG30_PYTOL|nr:hypothetical protein Poli38472_010946 [Pythium oligandrum]|eukprot:TMW61883.1 hypothetical protein Poli38472_010946 [Pythium oligandrum]